MATPNSYKDPYWSDLTAATEAKLGLPSGLLTSIVLNGERSNADQVSEVGAKTPFQITPQTRKLAVDKYGVDPYLSPENAAEVAGLLLKDSIERNKGDVAAAVGEYHGGTDRSNWGPKTRAYITRVTQQNVPTGQSGSTFSRALAKQQETQQQAPSIAKIYEAYKNGVMTPQEASEFEQDVKAGAIMLPRGATLKGQPEPAGPLEKTKAIVLPQGVADAYRSGQMTPQEKADLEADLNAGLVSLPPSLVSQIPDQEAAPTPQAPEPSLGQRLVGAGEAGLNVLTGATGGLVGSVLGAGQGITQALLNGTFGTNEAADAVERASMEGAQTFTYAPRTETGQQYAEAAGQALSQALPVTPFTAELGTIGAGLKATQPAVELATQRAASPVVRGVQAVQSKLRPAAPAPAPVAATPIAGAPEPTGTPAPVGPTAPPSPVAAAVRVAPPQILKDAETLAHPSDVAISPQVIAKRDAVLDALGLPPENRRLGAQSGNRPQIEQEVSISKLDGGEKMRQQFETEAQTLGQYANDIVADTGGTPGANGLQRGEAISAPLEGYQQWYKQRIKELYAQADEAAAQSGTQIPLNGLQEAVGKASNFAGKAENAAVRKGLIAYLKEQGLLDKEGKITGVTAEAAERVKQYLNSQWSPQNSGLIGKLKGLIDDDVLSVLPEDIYKEARVTRKKYAEIFDDPQGMAQILDISGPEGVNRSIALDVLPDRMAGWAAKNSAQFRHIVNTLSDMPTPELQTAANQAINEIRAHLVERIVGKNVDLGESAIGGQPRWKGTDDSMNRAMMPYKGKLDNLLGPEIAQRVETLRAGARILRPYDPNPSGTATAAMNLQSRLMQKAGEAIGGIGGAVGGGLTGGPGGAMGGAIAGRALAKKIASRSQQRAIEQAITKSLSVEKKQKSAKTGKF